MHFLLVAFVAGGYALLGGSAIGYKSLTAISTFVESAKIATLGLVCYAAVPQ